MIKGSSENNREQIPFISLVPFMLFAFGLAWGILSLFIHIWPDAQPYDTFLFVAAAVLVVWFNRKAMFTKEGVVTEVIPKLKAE